MEIFKDKSYPLQRALRAPVGGRHLYWILIFSMEGVNLASLGVLQKNSREVGSFPAG